MQLQVHFLFDSFSFVEQHEFFMQLLFFYFNIPCSLRISLFLSFGNNGTCPLFSLSEYSLLHFFDPLLNAARYHHLSTYNKSEIMCLISNHQYISILIHNSYHLITFRGELLMKIVHYLLLLTLCCLGNAIGNPGVLITVPFPLSPPMVQISLPVGIDNIVINNL